VDQNSAERNPAGQNSAERNPVPPSSAARNGLPPPIAPGRVAPVWPGYVTPGYAAAPSARQRAEPGVARGGGALGRRVTPRRPVRDFHRRRRVCAAVPGARLGAAVGRRHRLSGAARPRPRRAICRRTGDWSKTASFIDGAASRLPIATAAAFLRLRVAVVEPGGVDCLANRPIARPRCRLSWCVEYQRRIQVSARGAMDRPVRRQRRMVPLPALPKQIEKTCGAKRTPGRSAMSRRPCCRRPSDAPDCAARPPQPLEA